MTAASACCSWASACGACELDTLVWKSWRWALVAPRLNEERLAAWSDWAFSSAVLAAGSRLCSISAAVRMARCSEASSFIRDTRPSTRTVCDRVASLAPCAVFCSSTSRSPMIPLYFCTTTRAGSWLSVAASRRLGMLARSATATCASCRTRAGNDPPIWWRSPTTTAEARSVSWRWVYTTPKPAAPLPVGARPLLAPCAMK